MPVSDYKFEVARLQHMSEIKRIQFLARAWLDLAIAEADDDLTAAERAQAKRKRQELREVLPQLGMSVRSILVYLRNCEAANSSFF